MINIRSTELALRIRIPYFVSSQDYMTCTAVHGLSAPPLAPRLARTSARHSLAGDIAGVKTLKLRDGREKGIRIER